jgi:hypothetical protein
MVASWVSLLVYGALTARDGGGTVDGPTVRGGVEWSARDRRSSLHLTTDPSGWSARQAPLSFRPVAPPAIWTGLGWAALAAVLFTVAVLVGAHL